MKKNRFLLFVILFMFIGMTNVDAKSYSETPKSDRKCSNYFDIVDVVYGESVGVAGGFNQYYDSEKLNATHWIKGNQVIGAADNYWTNTASNITAWYYYNSYTKFTSDAKLTITVYNNKNSNICTETITGFNTSETHFKLRLQHNKKSQWVNLKGIFSDRGKSYSDTTFTSIKVDKEPAKISHTDTIYNNELAVQLTITDPNDWGKYDKKLKVNNIKFREKNGNFQSLEYRDINKKSFDECSDNEDKKCERVLVTVFLPSPPDAKNKSYEYEMDVEVVKKSGVKTNKTIKFELNNGEVKNTTTTTKVVDGKTYGEDGETCPDGSYKSKNGCAEDPNNGPAAGLVKGKTKQITEIGNGNSQLACDTIGDLFDEYWPYAMVIIPILLIIMMAIDFFKAMVVNDADALKKAGTNAVKRTIATVIALALPALLRMVFGLFGIDFCL